MARPVPTTINCPNCRQPFSAVLEQLLDTRVDPTVKERLLSGRINLITCPNCGYRGMIGTPIMYHDHSKQLAITYVPVELNLNTTDREKLIGSMTQAVMRSLPDEAPKGYLLQPKAALTIQGVIDLVLEADGITPDMVNAERRKAQLINELATASAAEQDKLIADNPDLLDESFFEMLEMVARSASEQGDARVSLRMLNLRKKLLDTTEIGAEIRRREEATREVIAELQAMGGRVTREQFVDLLAKHAHNDHKIDALAGVARAYLDYTTFSLITQKIEQADSPMDRTVLERMRDRLLAFAAEMERQSQAMVERATDTLRLFLQAPDLPAAIREHVDRIDELFLQVLQANLEQAQRGGNIEVSARLRQVYEEVSLLIQASMPPEVRFINDLLNQETEEGSLALLRERRAELSPELVDAMAQVVEQLREQGNDAVAERLERIAAEAAGLV